MSGLKEEMYILVAFSFNLDDGELDERMRMLQQQRVAFSRAESVEEKVPAAKVLEHRERQAGEQVSARGTEGTEVWGREEAEDAMENAERQLVQEHWKARDQWRRDEEIERKKRKKRKEKRRSRMKREK